VENDLLVVAKFACLDVSTTETKQSYVQLDPNEINLAEDNDLMNNEAVDDEDGSSSSSSSVASAVDEVELMEEEEDFEEEQDSEEETKKVVPSKIENNPIDLPVVDALPDQTSILPSDRIVPALTVSVVQKGLIIASSISSPILDSGSVICDEQGGNNDVFWDVSMMFLVLSPILSTVCCWLMWSCMLAKDFLLLKNFPLL